MTALFCFPGTHRGYDGGMRRIGVLLILVGLIVPVVPTVYAMISALNAGTPVDPRLIKLGLRLGMIGVPVALLGAVLIAISLLRSAPPRQ